WKIVHPSCVCGLPRRVNTKYFLKINLPGLEGGNEGYAKGLILFGVSRDKMRASPKK
ncbi:Hypothetical protein FKW44_021676, partial [Caligus rogercresseyi]